MILLGAQKEVPGLIKALKAGHVNGWTYSGECACLVGTIANVRGVDVDTLEQDSRRPAAQWFLMLREGDTPGDETGGGFAAGKALEWAEEFLALTAPAHPKAQQAAANVPPPPYPSDPALVCLPCAWRGAGGLGCDVRGWESEPTVAD